MWKAGISSPDQGLNRGSPAFDVQSLSHWTTREVPARTFYTAVLCKHPGSSIKLAKGNKKALLTIVGRWNAKQTK